MKTRKDIINDVRIEGLSCYDSGHWCVLSKKEFMFDNNSRTSVGTIKEIISDMKSLQKVEPEYQYD